MTLQIGGRLGHYRILSLLGRGGMADVYRAQDERLGREVALKAVPPEFERDPERVERFRREVRAAARLTHPNIVTVYEFGQGEGQHFYTMELMPGGDLKGRIRAHPEGMPPEEAREVAAAMARALDYAHGRGFVHRDVKPENILFGEDGSPQLTDFGIARAVSERIRMTATGMSIGSPHYMSPEQARGQLVDGRSDIYSLGVVLYEMLTGRLPFDSADTFEIGLSHINDPVPKLPREVADWQPLLERLMAKSPEDRYASAGEVAAVLESEARTEAPLPGVAPAPGLEPVERDIEEATRLEESAPEARAAQQESPSIAPAPHRDKPPALTEEESPEPHQDIPAAPEDIAQAPATRLEPAGQQAVPAAPLEEPTWVEDERIQFEDERTQEEEGTRPEEEHVRLEDDVPSLRDWLTELQTWATGQEEAAKLPRGTLAAVAGGLLALIVVGIIFLALPDTKPTEPVRRNRGAERGSVLGGDARLFVETTPAGAEVLVDGRRVGTTPLQRYDIRAGVREVVLRHPQYETVSIGGRRFRDGRVVRIRRVLEAATGELTVTTTPPGAWVEVNGERAEEGTPVTLGGLPAGRLEVKLGAREHRPLVVEVEIPKNGVARLEQALERIPYGSLTLDLEPPDARVTLPDVRPRYRPGLRLPRGVHRVVVRRQGYREAVRRVRVSGSTRVRIVLESLVQPGDLRIFDGMEFVWVPAGEFRMGSTGRFADSDERPVTRVRISQGFWLGKYEVTQRQWQAVMGRNPSHFRNCGRDCPVERVSWNEVQSFIGRLNTRSGGRPYRLPTEAEWEYAARAGTTGPYYANPNAIAWHRGNSGDRTRRVGRKAPNGFKLYDMLGNVWEWVADRKGRYPGGTATDPTGPGSGSSRVYRGGGWHDSSRACRAANRDGLQRSGRLDVLGFRLLREK